MSLQKVIKIISKIFNPRNNCNFFFRTYTTKPKSKTGSSHHKHKRKGRQPANPGQPKEKKKSTWAAINEKNYLCNLCGKTLKGLTAYKRHQVLLASTVSIWNKTGYL